MAAGLYLHVYAWFRLLRLKINTWFWQTSKPVRSENLAWFLWLGIWDRELFRKLTKEGIWNTLSPKQNGHHFADDISNAFLEMKHVCVSIKISVEFVPERPIDNRSAFVQVMAWHWTGDVPSPEPMMVNASDLTWRHNKLKQNRYITLCDSRH